MSGSATLRPGSPEEVDLLPDRIERARNLVADAVAKGRTPSAVALVARRGVVALHEAFGEQRSGGPALSRDAIWPISSATKPLTAALVMALVEDGAVSVGRPAVEYLPELAGDGIEDVFVHHLLTHTSGWDEASIAPWVAKKIASEGMPELPEHAHPLHELPLALCTDMPRSSRPGELMIYCNFNYTLLGRLVERVSGKPIQEFARERLFEPLGMESTDFVVRDDMRDRLMHRPPQAPMGAEIMGMPGTESEAWERMPNGAGGAYSTAHDLAIFGQMILNGGSYAGQRVLGHLLGVECETQQNYDDVLGLFRAGPGREIGELLASLSQVSR